MRPVLVRSLAVLGVGLLALVGILYYASTVDGRPPRVERIGLTQHRSGDDRVALTTTSVQVVFSEPVRTDTAEVAYRMEPMVAGAASWSGATMTFTPGQRLPLETEFRVWIDAGVADRAGNAMAEASAPFEFSTVGPPAVAATDPVDGANDVPLDASIVIEFSNLMDTASVEAALVTRPAVAWEASWSAERLTLVAADQLAEGTAYTITVGTGARDSGGIPLASAHRFSFTTTGSPLAPSGIVPADGSDGVAVSTPIAIFFDRELDPDSVTSEMLRIDPQLSGSLDVIAAPGAAGLVDGAARILRFEPSAPLAPNTTYRVTLDLGLAAADGSQLAGRLDWSFTTGAPLSTLSNQIVFISDRGGVANLWAMNPDGSAPRQVSAELSGVIDYAVAPDGRSVLTGDGAVLVLLDASGVSRTVLTPPDALEYDPAWAPDGSRFAFGRSDLAGEGQGIWIRDGGDATRLEMPAELGGSPAPGPAEGGAVLRAPRFSPDGAALAFVDISGRVGVLELPAGRLSTAPFVAVGPPAWLRDSTGLLLPGMPGDPLSRPDAGQPMPALDPGALRLPATRLASLVIARLDRGATGVRAVGLPPGSTRPAVSRAQALFVVTPGTSAAAGELWLSDEPVDPAADRRLLDDGGAPVLSATFGIEPGSLIVSRQGDGIWLADTGTGMGERIAPDGWLARWLP